MIAASHLLLDPAQTDPAPKPVVEAAVDQDKARLTSSDQAHEPSDPPALSQQTLWLLKVRDQRDRAAYAQLFSYFAPRLKAMLLRGGLRDGRAEDVVQDVMLAVWHKAGQFDPHRSEASGWIYRIARNRHIDLRRRGQVFEAELTDDHTSEEPDSFQMLALSQEHQKLRAALDTLAPEQSQLLQKAFFEEMPHSEISSLTGLPLGTIKSRIRLGLARIRRELSDLRHS